jgi:hypothetical protein
MLWSSSICGLGSFFLSLFTEVPRRDVLGSSPNRNSQKFCTAPALCGKAS